MHFLDPAEYWHKRACDAAPHAESASNDDADMPL
jgi:hypothetical protein